MKQRMRRFFAVLMMLCLLVGAPRGRKRRWMETG